MLPQNIVLKVVFSHSSHCRFLLKQEQEKHQSASMLYDKTREQLRRKEEEHRAEAEERQKVELNMRNLELEMRALMNTMKQVIIWGKQKLGSEVNKCELKSFCNPNCVWPGLV